MKYRNRLPVATLLGMPALYIGVILAVLSGIALRTGDSHIIIPIAGLAASLLVVASAIALILRKPGSRSVLSFGLHTFVLIFAVGCVLYHDAGVLDLFTVFGFVVFPIILLVVCLHNQTLIEQLEDKDS